MGIIYKISNTCNNKIYIGQTIRPLKTRWQQHLEATGCPTKLGQAMSFLGKENFFIEIIENCPNELLNERERYWIKFYNSYNDGYNMTHGGGICRGTAEDKLCKEIYDLWDQGFGLTAIAQELEIGLTMVCNRIHSYKNYSEEECQKRALIARSIGKYKEVYQWDFLGNLIGHYQSLQEASQKTNTSYKALSAALKNNGSSNGFLWSFNNIFPQNAKCNNQKKVAQYDLQGNLLQIYSSRAEASRQTGIDSSSIAKCCNKKQKTCKGYIWKNLE